MKTFADLMMLGAALAATLAAGPALADAAASSAAFGRASAAFDQGDVRAARVELMNALKENPNNAAARLLNARVLLRRGDGVAAQTEIERAVRAGAPKDRTHHLMAESFLLQRQFNKALDEARGSRVPPQFAAYAARVRGRAQAGLGVDSAAGEEFARATRLGPTGSENWTDFARYRASKRDIAGAGQAIDRALALGPTNVQALLLKGELTRATMGPNGLAQSLPFFNRAIAVDGNNIEALLERAATLGDLKREKEARADIAKVKGLAPEHPLALYLEAVLAARGGKFKEAQTLLSNTKGMLDRYPPAQMLQGMVAFQLGNVVQARESFNRLVTAAPQNPMARRLLAMTQLRANDPRGALTTLKPLEAAGARLDAGTLSLLGSAHARAGNFAVAQAYLERAAQQAPQAGNQLGTQIAMTRFAQGDLSGAEGQLQQVLAADPNSLQALVTLSAVKVREGDFRAAGAAAQRLVTNYPKLPIGYNLRGTALLGLRDVKKAEINFRQALAQKPDYIDARRNLAQLLLITNRRDEARKELGVMLQQNPKDVRAMLLMAEVAGAANNVPERIDWLRRATTAAPAAIEPRAALVQTYIVANQPNRALNEASALARTSRDPRALQLLGGAQVAAKQLPAARQTFERLVTSQPNAVEPRIMLARVQTVAGDLPAARATYDAALKLPNARTEAIYTDIIGLELRARNFDGALARAEALKRSTPQKAAADKLIGDINMAANRPAAALVAYNRVKTQVNNAQVASAIAAAQMRLGKPTDAFATLTGFATANPRDPAGQAAVADFHIARKDWRRAIATYEGMRRGGLAANDPGILNNLAWSLHQVGDRRAVGIAAEAHKRAPRAPAVLDTYGLILVATGSDAKRGLGLLQQASRGAPADPNIRLHLAQAYRANNLRAEARREAQLALRSPQLENPAAARQLLAQLGG